MHRRFIAGAVCPRCSQMDKLFLYRDGQQSVRECVACGFRELMQEDGRAQELTTRVNQPRLGEVPLAHEDEVQRIRVLDDDVGTKGNAE